MASAVAADGLVLERFAAVVGTAGGEPSHGAKHNATRGSGVFIGNVRRRGGEE